MQIPHRDEPIAGGFKRVIWPKGDAIEQLQKYEREAAAKTSKRGKQYSRADQQKIAQEKYGEFCERKPQFGDNE